MLLPRCCSPLSRSSQGHPRPPRWRSRSGRSPVLHPSPRARLERTLLPGTPTGPGMRAPPTTAVARARRRPPPPIPALLGRRPSRSTITCGRRLCPCPLPGQAPASPTLRITSRHPVTAPCRRTGRACPYRVPFRTGPPASPPSSPTASAPRVPACGALPGRRPVSRPVTGPVSHTCRHVLPEARASDAPSEDPS
jgi:hypothetical protein